MYGPYYESLAAVPNRELSAYLPGRDAAKDAEPIETAEAKHEGFLWDKEEFSFEDVLDLINPLHHLPLVSTLYRESTGDTIGAVPRVLGGALYGFGPIGAAIGAGSALVNVAVEAVTGKDVGGTMVALLSGGEPEGTALADSAAETSSAAGRDTGLAAHAAAAVASTVAPAAAPPHPPETPSSSRVADAIPAAAGAVLAAPRSQADVKGDAAGPAAATVAEGGTARRTGAAANAWISQSIMSGLEKYRAMAKAQDRKPAGLDAVY